MACQQGCYTEGKNRFFIGIDYQCDLYISGTLNFATIESLNLKVKRDDELMEISLEKQTVIN